MMMNARGRSKEARLSRRRRIRSRAVVVASCTAMLKRTRHMHRNVVRGRQFTMRGSLALFDWLEYLDTIRALESGFQMGNS